MSRFDTLALPQRLKDNAWMGLARKLTWQSQTWERRAFTMSSLIPPLHPGQQSGAHARGRSRLQTFPPQVIVDACSKVKGQQEEEMVAWGAGEDVVVRWRDLRRSSLKKEVWMAVDGSANGFESGRDDVTAISILNDARPGPALLVGRASGYLQLLSTKQDKFGSVMAWLLPIASEGGPIIEQRTVQHFDIDIDQTTAVVVTKDNLHFYPLIDPSPDPDTSNDPSQLTIPPIESYVVRDLPGSRPFRFLRAVKFMDSGDLALALTSKFGPLRYLSRTPTGTVVNHAAKLQPSRRCQKAHIYDDGVLQTVRSLLPVNTGSAAGGSGSVILSSYDDGTVRLQDLRSPSPIDAIYQDHFEIFPPLGPLVSYGTERFIAGSARTSIIKIFDFRWTKNYYHTDALQCGKIPLKPPPKPLTVTTAIPHFPERSHCLHLPGGHSSSCTLHLSARTTFYRPSCNIYIPLIHQVESPIYSLAKPSDTSSTLYAGLASELVTMSLRDPSADAREMSVMQRMGKKNRCGYTYHQHHENMAGGGMVETGDGIALSDSSKSQRVPDFRKQKRGEKGQVSASAMAGEPMQQQQQQSLYRLDLSLM